MKKIYQIKYLCFFDRDLTALFVLGFLFCIDYGVSSDFFDAIIFTFFLLFLSEFLFFIFFARKIILDDENVFIFPILGKKRKSIKYSEILKIDDQSSISTTMAPFKIFTKLQQYNIYPFFIKNSADLKKEIVIRVKMCKEAEKEKGPDHAKGHVE